MNQNQDSLALSGLRVLDLTRVLAGPICTMMLADMGADVIKVERPGEGDESRGWGPPFHENGQSGYFLAVNRNKKSIALDLGAAEHREIFLGLLRKADVVVDNFRPGSLEKMGVSPLQCVAENPRLVWCSITGFGPASGRPGYDYVVQAEQGWMSISGEKNGQPLKTGVAFADVITGKDAAIAILGAVTAVARGVKRDAQDRLISISLKHSATSALINVAQNVLMTGKDAVRHGNEHPNLVPYQLFQAADRPIVLAIGNDSQWMTAMKVLGLDDLRDDVSLRNNAGRVRERERVITRIGGKLAEKSAGEWLAALSREGVPSGIVRSVGEALEEFSASVLTGVPPSVPGSVRFAAPQLDEHGAAIRQLGWEVFAKPERT